MPTDRRLFDSSSMTPPPALEIDATTCTNAITESPEVRSSLMADWIAKNIKLTPYQPEPWQESGLCSATIWMGTQRQSGWPFRRSRRDDDCRGPTITQGIFS